MWRIVLVPRGFAVPKPPTKVSQRIDAHFAERRARSDAPTTLLDWRRLDAGRALWWRGKRVQLVRFEAGARIASQIFESEASAVQALATDGVAWAPLAPPIPVGLSWER